MQEKVRECGDASLISVQEMEGQQVLVIDSVHGEEMYSSYIYLEDGNLKELFVKKADFAGLEGGQELVELESFSVDRPENDLLALSVSAAGQQETVYIRLPVSEE